ncbi:predicted protein [Uncinocarpus reesii 1704]|uniref:Uncharacterized protein n=1 Tax=Uncinocarpus reesii (strain UAMH 1704) TaxID=336963 RepID=C4JHK7_UNCRE|nr:uncharacterized protein UREG_01370 [Uncinocarpus reesii 1704]EEP76521.1 predicted protein [Uncinocarpus reesii 1704]
MAPIRLPSVRSLLDIIDNLFGDPILTYSNRSNRENAFLTLAEEQAEASGSANPRAQLTQRQLELQSPLETFPIYPQVQEYWIRGTSMGGGQCNSLFPWNRQHVGSKSWEPGNQPPAPGYYPFATRFSSEYR